MEDNIRNYDETFSDRLIYPLNESLGVDGDDIFKTVLDQVKEEILICIPSDEDSLDQLIVKKIQMEEEIFPKLSNFHLKCDDYDNIYINLSNRIKMFENNKIEDKIEDHYCVTCQSIHDQKPYVVQEELPLKTKREIDREHRMKYYSKSK